MSRLKGHLRHFRNGFVTIIASLCLFGKYVFGGKYRQVDVEVILLIQLTTTQRPTPSLLCLSPFVVVAADGLAHKAGHCWPCCHSNQEILTAVSGVPSV